MGNNPSAPAILSRLQSEAAALGKGDIELGASALFAKLDADGDGAITLADLRVALSKFMLADGPLTACLALLGASEDGHATLADVNRLLITPTPPLAEAAKSTSRRPRLSGRSAGGACDEKREEAAAVPDISGGAAAATGGGGGGAVVKSALTSAVNGLLWDPGGGDADATATMEPPKAGGVPKSPKASQKATPRSSRRSSRGSALKPAGKKAGAAKRAGGQAEGDVADEALASGGGGGGAPVAAAAAAASGGEGPRLTADAMRAMRGSGG